MQAKVPSRKLPILTIYTFFTPAHLSSLKSYVNIKNCRGEITNCVFEGIIATGEPLFGLALSNCTNITISNCSIRNYGDAVRNFQGTIANSVFHNNTIAIQDGSGNIINCTINKSDTAIKGNFTVKNSIIVNNDIGLSATTSESNYNNLWGNSVANYESPSTIPGANDIHRYPII